jgi:DNA-binding transcriptional LysR family regulator
LCRLSTWWCASAIRIHRIHLVDDRHEHARLDQSDDLLERFARVLAHRKLQLPAAARGENGLQDFPKPAVQRKVDAVLGQRAWELVKAGLGIGKIIEEVGDLEPLVERVLPSMAPIAVPMWLVAHREVHTSRRVRMVFDLIAEELGPSQRANAPRRATKRGRSVSTDTRVRSARR